MTIGLTGARGVLGRRLSEAFETRGLSVLPFDGDVRDVAALTDWAARCTRIVHAAAVVPTVQVKEAPGTAITVNVAGTANVATAAAAAGATLAYISTSHVYASSNAPLSEAAAIAPVSLYGLSKWQGEQWVDQLIAKPLIVRIFSYFDSLQAETFLIPALYRRVLDAPFGAELPLMGFRSVRDIADARWLADRLAELVLSDAAETLNLGTGIATPIARVAERLAAAAGRKDISWIPADDHSGDMLVADTGLVRSFGEGPDFDLDLALQRFVAEISI